MPCLLPRTLMSGFSRGTEALELVAVQPTAAWLGGSRIADGIEFGWHTKCVPTLGHRRQPIPASCTKRRIASGTKTHAPPIGTTQTWCSQPHTRSPPFTSLLNRTWFQWPSSASVGGGFLLAAVYVRGVELCRHNWWPSLTWILKPQTAGY